MQRPASENTIKFFNTGYFSFDNIAKPYRWWDEDSKNLKVC